LSTANPTRRGAGSIDSRSGLAGNPDRRSMLDYRVSIIDLLDRDRSGRPRGCCKTRTIYYSLAARCGGLSGGNSLNLSDGRFSHSGTGDRIATHRGHSFHRDATIDDCGLVDGVVVNNGRAIVNPSDFCWLQPVAAKIPLPEIMDPNKGKMIGMKTEIKVYTNVNTIKPTARPDLEYGAKGQGGPTAVVA